MTKPAPKRLFSHVLLYHAVFRDIPPSLRNNLHNVVPDQLHKQLSWMKEQFDIVALDELSHRSSREGTFAVTFDDAYESVFSNALPVLEDLAIPATIFVIGSTLSQQVFWRDKVRLLIQSGRLEEFIEWAQLFCAEHEISAGNFYKQSKTPGVNSGEVDRLLTEFLSPELATATNLRHCVERADRLLSHPLLTYGNHTFRHYVLTSLDEHDRETEIRRNAALLAELNLRRSDVFSVPFGGRGSFDAATFETVRSAGYRAALLSRHKVNANTEGPLPSIHDLPIIERYMPTARFTDFPNQVAALIRAADTVTRQPG